MEWGVCMKIKIENWKFILLGIFYVLFGILSYAIPQTDFLSFFKILGLIIVFVGLFQILVFIFKKEYLEKNSFAASLGILITIAGFLIFQKAHLIVYNYPYVFSCAVILDSIFRFQFGVNLISFKQHGWKFIMSNALISIAMAVILLTISLGDIQKNFFSAMLILDAIFMFITILYYQMKLKASHLDENLIEIDKQ